MVSNVGRSLDDFSIPTSQRAASEDLGQEDFLKLMVEQMRNQNPLDPQDNGEFFSQIAQFQTLDAMNVISQAITTLVEISGLSNASALIGKSITAEVPQSPDPATGFPRPPQEVEGVVDRVTFDANGAVLHIGALAIPSSAVTEISDSTSAAGLQGFGASIPPFGQTSGGPGVGESTATGVPAASTAPAAPAVPAAATGSDPAAAAAAELMAQLEAAGAFGYFPETTEPEGVADETPEESDVVGGAAPDANPDEANA